MAERDTLQKLIDVGTVATTLGKGSSARHAIAALQTLLHWLGFDRQLKWEKYGADGDYGSATTAAVAEFARRNGSAASGEGVTKSLAGSILERYDSLEELKQVAADVEKEAIEKVYRTGGTDRIRIAALQTLLCDLGYGRQLNWDRFGADGDYGRSTTAAVAAFGRREGMATDGTVLPLALAARLVEQLAECYGDSWDEPSHTATPVAGSLSVESVLGRNNRQYLRVSDGDRDVRFAKFRLGLFTPGTNKPAGFVESHANELRAIGVTQSEINVMIAVAENEGNLDAINTWDNAFLSFGIFQWTAGPGSGKGELPALLARIKNEDPDLFDRYCGQHGLDVAAVTPGQDLGYFSLRGQTIRTAAAKEQLRQVAWAFYFWRAGQDPQVQAMQIKHALSRLDRFYSSRDCLVDDKYLISDLVTSEYGVGLVLDQHVNRPAHLAGCLSRALARTRLTDPGRWGTDDERELIDAYLDIRVSYGSTPMTDAAKRARITKKYVANGTISDRRGSFKRSRRSFPR